MVVTRFRYLAVSAVVAGALVAATTDYLSAKKKLDEIGSDRLRAGTRVVLTTRELNAWVSQDLPEGVRNPKLEIPSRGIVRGAAMVDFGKVRRAQGQEPGWLMSKLLDGERPVSVTAKITSGKGQATVDVERVEISGLVIDGRTLDFLIQNFLIPLYPDAVVGRPFELGHHIEKLDIQPVAVAVLIGQ
jgi:hypothetical protein